MEPSRLSGLVAATYTPMHPDGSLDLTIVNDLVERLLEDGITGLYVCGSTGEGMSLTSEERRMTAEAYVRAARGRVPVIVQVGHNSIVEARQLAEHALAAGADIISATCPSYFKVSSVETLVDCMSELAAGAPDLPFYYYHIPALTGSSIDIVRFLSLAGTRIPNLVGLKYTDTKLFEFQSCLDLQDNRFDVVWGCDEMLLGALATGSRAAIGSTYNIAGPLYRQMITAFEKNDLAEARRLQSQSIQLIRILNHYPFHSAMKAVLAMRGFPVGRCRLPQNGLTDSEIESLKSELNELGYFHW